MLQRAKHAFQSVRASVLFLAAGAWKHALVGLALLVLLAAIGGFLYLWAGLVPISASSGHWPVTHWILHFTMRSSVRTQSLGIEPPPLDDPALVLKGAGHYETGCVPCHGAPGQERSLIVRKMTPEPPYLPPKIPEWERRELFWIVKHGVKFTAMPAWPALERDDEVWALVAFLERLPEMSPERYIELANDPSATPSAGGTPDHRRPPDDPLVPVLANCARCHGADGNGRSEGAFPKLAGQSEPYLLASLQAYATGERHSGIMQPIAADLDPVILHELARYYAELPKTGAGKPVERGDAAGFPAARVEDRESNLPRCKHCHGPKEGPRNPLYPDLAGQYANYLALQLELFQKGKRGGSEYANVMHSVARRLDSRQIREIAEYYASLKWGEEAEPEEVGPVAGAPADRGEER